MKLRKLIAGAAVAVMAAAILAVSASASQTSLKDSYEEGYGIRLFSGENENYYYYGLNDVLLNTYGIRVYLELGDEDWIGGGLGTNSDTKGWRQNEWGTGGKPINVYRDKGYAEWINSEPLFSEKDTYCHVWCQTWSGTAKVKKFETLDKAGNVILSLNVETGEEIDNKPVTAPAAEEPAAETKEEETKEEVKEETKEETKKDKDKKDKDKKDKDKEETAVDEEEDFDDFDDFDDAFDDEDEDGDIDASEEDIEDAEIAPTLVDYDTDGAFYAEFGAQFDADYIDEWPTIDNNKLCFDYNKVATLKIDFGKKIRFGQNYIAVNTNVPYAEGMEAEILSFKLDGEEIEMGDAYLNSEGIDGGLRLTIANLWNDQIEEQPLDPSELPEFRRLQIKFRVYKPEETEDAIDEAADFEEVVPLSDCFIAGDLNQTILVADDGLTAYCTENGLDVTDVYGYRVTAWINPDAVANEDTWIGGGIGANSNSTGWFQQEWGRVDKAYTIDLDTGVVEWLADDPIFSADDAYAQLWFSVWSEKSDIAVTKVEVLGKGGTVLAEAEFEAPAEVDTPDVTLDEDEIDEAAADEEEAVAEVISAVVDTTANVSAAEASANSNPKTGVTDIAGAAALALAAAGIVLVSRKRK